MEGYVFTGVCLHFGGGNPIWLTGGTPIWPTSWLMGVRVGWGSPLGWDWMGYPPLGTGWDTPPCQHRMGYPSHQDWMGVLPHQDWMGYPPCKTKQQSERLLRGERYASCVQAGGHSCSQSLMIKKD